MSKKTKATKVKKVMGEYKDGSLKSGSGKPVLSRKQAISEAKKKK